jgi:hypothetical protein
MEERMEPTARTPEAVERREAEERRASFLELFFSSTSSSCSR